MFLKTGSKISQKEQNIASYLVIHSVIGDTHTYSDLIMARNQLRMRQRASYGPRDLGLEDVSGRPPEVPGYQTRQFNVQDREHQAGTVVRC